MGRHGPPWMSQQAVRAGRRSAQLAVCQTQYGSPSNAGVPRCNRRFGGALLCWRSFGHRRIAHVLATGMNQFRNFVVSTLAGGLMVLAPIYIAVLLLLRAT